MEEYNMSDNQQSTKQNTISAQPACRRSATVSTTVEAKANDARGTTKRPATTLTPAATTAAPTTNKKSDAA